MATLTGVLVGIGVGAVVGIGYGRIAIHRWYNTGHVHWWQSRREP